MNKNSSLLALFEAGEPVKFKKGDIIISPEDPPHNVYFLVQGFVKTFQITELGNEQIHLIYKPGEIFSVKRTLLGRRSQAFYQAMTPVVIRKISKEAFFEAIKENPHVTDEIMYHFAGLLDLYASTFQSISGCHKCRPRLVSTLIYLADRFGKNQNGKIHLELPLTHQDIGDLANMTRETTSRDLEKLEEEGLLEYKDHYLTIRDLDKLEQQLQ